MVGGLGGAGGNGGRGNAAQGLKDRRKAPAPIDPKAEPKDRKAAEAPPIQSAKETNAALDAADLPPPLGLR